MPKSTISSRRVIRLKHPPLETRHPPRRHFRISYYVLAAMLTIAARYRPINTYAATTPDCTDVEFIFARGSGESLSSDTYHAWELSLNKELRRELDMHALTYHFYELGSKDQQGYQYPAVRVAGDLEGIINLGGAAISGGEAYAFGESVSAGVNELKTYIKQTLSACPRTRFVLGGYSQGAMVITHSLPDLDPNRIIYAATFGDPKLYLPEGARSLNNFYIPEACYGINLSIYREYVPDCYAYAGILGAAIPYQPLGYVGKLGTWCNDKDIMCSSGLSIQDHTSYVLKNLYADAARSITRAIKSAFIDLPDEHIGSGQQIHEVAIVADITGSMSYNKTYQRLTEETEKLATKVITAGGRVSFFVYLDLQEGTTTKRLCDFTCTVDELHDAITSVKLDAGKDGDESALSAINYAVQTINWSANSNKSLLVLTDAGFHDPDYDGVTSADVIAISQSYGVKIFVPIRKKYAGRYEAITSQTGGEVLILEDGIMQITEAIIPSPAIRLTQTHYEGLPNSSFVFDASDSGVFIGPDLTYDWDLDDDGAYELRDAGPIVEKTFEQFDGSVFVRATDCVGDSTIASIRVKVQDQPEPSPLANISNVAFSSTAGKVNHSASADADQKIVATVSFSTDAEHVLLAIDEAVIGFVQIANGEVNFTVRDIAPYASLTLVPYAADGRRGASHVIRLGDGVDASTRQPTSPDDITSNILPKAPNTGVRSISRQEVGMSIP